MNPYCIYNGLDGDYTPWEGGDPTPPPYPSRLRYFTYGLSLLAYEDDIKLAGGKVSKRRGG